MDPSAHVAYGVVPLRRSALSWLACFSIALAMPVLTPNPAAAAELSPAAVAEMFLKALELQGRNPRVIRSGDISYEERITRAQETRERHEENARRHISALERLVKEATNDIARERWKNEIEALRKEAEAGPPQQTPTDWIKRDVFVGNNPRKRSRDEAALKEPSNGLKSEQIRLCESDGSERAFLNRFPEARDTSLYRNAFSVSSTEYCGRARGPMALAITTFLLANGGSHDEFTFSPAATESPQEAFKAVGSTLGWGGGRIPHLAATGTFEGSEVFEIEFGMGDRWSSNAPPRKTSPASRPQFTTASSWRFKPSPGTRALPAAASWRPARTTGASAWATTGSFTRLRMKFASCVSTASATAARFTADPTNSALPSSWTATTSKASTRPSSPAWASTPTNSPTSTAASTKSSSASKARRR